MGTNQKGKAIYRVREIESPIHHVFRGLRIEVALPNWAGRKPFSDITVPSFDKPYFICRFGDYESWEYLTKKWPSIWRAINNMGFTSVEQYKPEDHKDDSMGAHLEEPTGLEDPSE